jgi:hypothetical protein
MSITIQEAETLAAISAVFHSSQSYQRFYDLYGEALNGFPGIWNLCARMGMAFIRAEEEIKPDWDGQWIEAVDTFVASIYNDISLTDEELYMLAKQSIREAL